MENDDLKDIPIGVFVFVAICASMPYLLIGAIVCCSIIFD